MGWLTVAGPALRRLTYTRKTLFVALALCLVWFLGLQIRDSDQARWGSLGLRLPDMRKPPRRMPADNVLPPLAARKLCYGPRGKLLTQSPDDDLVVREMEMPYPVPFAGSYEALGIDLTYMTADARYGPYGFGEERDNYKRRKVDWKNIDWGKLQNDCFERNKERFPDYTGPFEDARQEIRLAYRNESKIPTIRHWHEFEATRRTALVVRVWRGYEYTPEDMHYLRSLAVEGGLKTGGEYQLILLVDMKDYEGYENEIFASEENYQQGLKDSGVPEEFMSIAVLWDNRLLQSWYPDVLEHRTMWQVFQPMQLFALHYPEFDHFWQLELDMRFTGDAGAYLDRLTAFARKEPRKQALERASWWHMQSHIGDYNEYKRTVDKANKGGSHAWGPMRIKEILPIGPVPPVADPRNDTFQWGVGEEADVIVTSYCNDANQPNSWVFKTWIYNIQTGDQTPRFFCPPAIMRTSRALMFAIHQAQVEQGIRIPSEATPPSFALWHGLKLSYPQHPIFHRDGADLDIQNGWWRGGPLASDTGLGPNNLHHPRGNGLSFWWESDWPRQIFSKWQGLPLDEGVPHPYLLYDVDGQLWMPNLILHPMKHIKSG